MQEGIKACRHCMSLLTTAKLRRLKSSLRMAPRSTEKNRSRVGHLCTSRRPIEVNTPQLSSWQLELVSMLVTFRARQHSTVRRTTVAW
mmetsp:Transcript_27198/g.54730  ORF Transcript_27198/g.54730 Transcript_27198/m.54730 type:complete len:88 (-) Transcript_27198:1053-1316(-)